MADDEDYEEYEDEEDVEDVEDVDDEEEYEDEEEEVEEAKPVRPTRPAKSARPAPKSANPARPAKKPVRTTKSTKAAAPAASWANPQVLVAAAIVLLIAIGLGLWLGGVFKSSKPKFVTSIGPFVYNESGLRARAGTLGTPFYWVGPKPGMSYEFTRNTHGTLFVRYVPTGTPPNGKVKNALIIVTYPVTKPGYLGLLRQAQAKGAVQHGANGSIIYPNGSDVYVAFKSNPLAQVVVYDKKKTIAAHAAPHVVLVTG